MSKKNLNAMRFHPLNGLGTFYADEVARCNLYDGTILTFGGCVDTPNPYKDSGDLHDEIFQFDGTEWNLIGRAPGKRASGSSIEFIDPTGARKVFVAGGWADGWGNEGSAECFIFSLDSCTCEKLPEMLVGMKKPKLTLEEGHTILIKQGGKQQIWNFIDQRWEY